VISCNTVTASSDTLGVHSHAADEGGQLAWSALAHPRLSSRARTDLRPQLSAARVLLAAADGDDDGAIHGDDVNRAFRAAFVGVVAR
jgi:hypothetical protein